ncbi:MAG: GxxExxY protein [Acidobacteriota bacterium]
MSRQDAMHAKTDAKEPCPEIDALAREVIGAAIEVHRWLGPGFLESIYEEALCLELEDRGVRFERQVRLPVLYRERIVGEHRLDILVESQLVVELKHVETLAAVHVAQLISYLKAGAFQLGLLMNFNVPILKNGVRRVIWNG